jgi:hypothetical protein
LKGTRVCEAVEEQLERSAVLSCLPYLLLATSVFGAPKCSVADIPIDVSSRLLQVRIGQQLSRQH